MKFDLTPRDKAIILEFLFFYSKDKKTSEEWTELLCGDFTEEQFIILDPDGWRRPDGIKYSKDKISLVDYIDRLSSSTINFGYVNLIADIV